MLIDYLPVLIYMVIAVGLVGLIGYGLKRRKVPPK